MDRQRFLFPLITFIFCATLLPASAQEILPKTQRPASAPTFAQKLFIEAGGGWDDLTSSLIQLGDSSVTAVPSAKGPAWFMAFGIRPVPWLRFQFEQEREKVAGNGSFAQHSSDPNESGGATGNFGIGTDSRMFVAEFDPWPSHKIHPFGGLGFGVTTVTNRFNGTSDPVTYIDPDSGTPVTVTEPVAQSGKQNTWDGTVRVGIRYRPNRSMEFSMGFCFKDSLGAKASLVIFPAEVFSHFSRK